MMDYWTYVDPRPHPRHLQPPPQPRNLKIQIHLHAEIILNIGLLENRDMIIILIRTTDHVTWWTKRISLIHLKAAKKRFYETHLVHLHTLKFDCTFKSSCSSSRISSSDSDDALSSEGSALGIILAFFPIILILNALLQNQNKPTWRN